MFAEKTWFKKRSIADCPPQQVATSGHISCRLAERVPGFRIELMNHPDPLRQHLVNLLIKAEAHVDVGSELRDFPSQIRGRKPKGSPHTPWQLLEHMRIVQWDILRYSEDSKHKSPKFPDGYWPKTDAPPSDEAWDGSIRQFLADLDAMCALVRDTKRDLFAPIPHGGGQTLLREALLVADHNAYHLGQLVLIRRTLENE